MYPRLLHRFAANGPFRLGPMSKTEAGTARREIYRWLGYVRDALSTGDPAAADLHRISCEITWRVEAADNDSVYILVDRNPLVVAMNEIEGSKATPLPLPTFSNTPVTPLTPEEIAAYKRIAAEVSPPADPYATLRNPDDAADK